MTSEEKQRSRSKKKPGTAPSPLSVGYTSEEIEQLTAAALAKLKAGGEISTEEATAVVSGMKGATDTMLVAAKGIEEFHHLSAELQNEISHRVTAQESTKWKVKPVLEPMKTVPPESGIGRRIAYCRGQLDNLPVEALARYTKNFDAAGISRTTIVRYESGDNIPGGRELRILCDALWVPANWLLYGAVDAADENSPIARMAQALRHLIRQEAGMGLGNEVGGALAALEEKAKREEIERRQRWLNDARKPPSKK